MGLDITVRVNASVVLDYLPELENTLQENEARRILLTMPQDKPIQTRPGSYSGIHVVRAEYAKLKGWGDSVSGHIVAIDDRTEGSHLINHCDAEGYYLPDEFVEPQWLQTSAGHNVSVGSSVRLLDELTELLSVKDKWPDGFQRRWDAIFIVAVASVVARELVRFH